MCRRVRPRQCTDIMRDIWTELCCLHGHSRCGPLRCRRTRRCSGVIVESDIQSEWDHSITCGPGISRDIIDIFVVRSHKEEVRGLVVTLLKVYINLKDMRLVSKYFKILYNLFVGGLVVNIVCVVSVAVRNVIDLCNEMKSVLVLSQFGNALFPKVVGRPAHFLVGNGAVQTIRAVSLVVLVFVVAVAYIAIWLGLAFVLATIFAVKNVQVDCSISRHAPDFQDREKIRNQPFDWVRVFEVRKLTGIDFFYCI